MTGTLDTDTPDNVVQLYPKADTQSTSPEVGMIEMKGIFGKNIPAPPDMPRVTIERFTSELEVATACTSLKVLVLNIDSPGGEGQEMKQIADAINNFKRRHPDVRIVANVMNAKSAALWTIANCDHVHISPHGEIGSLGIYSGYPNADLEKEGIQASPTSKVRANETAMKSDLASLQAEHRKFRELVYNSRSKKAAAAGTPWPSLAELDQFDDSIVARKKEARAYAEEVVAVINSANPTVEELFELAGKMATQMPELRSLVEEQATNLKMGLFSPADTTEQRMKFAQQLIRKFEERVELIMLQESALAPYHRLLYQAHSFEAADAYKYGMVDSVGGKDELNAALREMGVANPDRQVDISAQAFQQRRVNTYENEMRAQVEAVNRLNEPERTPETSARARGNEAQPLQAKAA